MTAFFFLAACVMTASAGFLLHLLVGIVRAWWLHKRAIEQSEKLSAKIIAVEVMDDESRSVPFVRMILEIRTGEAFRVAEGFYPCSELAYLQVGKFVSAVLHPSDNKRLTLVREQARVSKAKEPITVLSIPPKQKLSVA